jgi:geranylgeranyl diphosphate synthase type II
VCEGQQFDMDFESMDFVTIPDYINMIRLKTAVLLGCSLQIGALSAEANPAHAKFIYDFGVNIGIAFQLKDDFLDSFGELEKFGKKIGGDISENKKTFLYLKCLELANADDRARLTALYSGNQSAPDRKVAKVLQLFDKYDIKSHTINEMEKYFNQATEILNRIKVNKVKKAELQHYAEWLYKRDH